MKALLNKTIAFSFAAILLCITSINAQQRNAQLKIKDYKLKHDLLLHGKQNHSFKNSPQGFGFKINPYWQDVNAPHLYNSYNPQVLVPAFNAVWAKISFDSIGNDGNQFIRTADGGKTWRQDSVDAPNGYGLSCLAAVDANTCYAAMYDAFNYGGAMFKTTNGGDTWRQVQPGKLYSANSFPDIVYFFDAQHGVTVGDDDLTDTSRLEIYTTSDAGKTWQRVPDKNLPPTQGYAFSSNFNGFAAFQNRIWVEAGDTYGNNYIYRSDDFGNHWKQFNNSNLFQYWQFAFSDKLNGVATGFNDTESIVAASHDGGETWTPVNFSGYPMAFLANIPGTHSFVSASPCCIPINGGSHTINGSSSTNDYGKTWHLIDSGADASHTAVAFLNPFIGWTGEGDNEPGSGGMYKWKYQFSLDNDAVARQIPERFENLPYFKQRASMLESLSKPHGTGKLNDMRSSPNAPCLKAQTTLGGSGDDVANKLIPTFDGGFIVAGGTNSGDGDFHVPAANGGDAFIAKYNKQRQLEWTKTFGGTGDDFFNDIAQNIDGSYIAAGYSSSTDGNVSGNHGSYDVWVVKLSASGKIEWQKSYGGTGDEFGNSLVQTLYGYAIGGASNSTDGDVSGNHGDVDAWVIQIDFKGKLLSEHSYGGSAYDQINSIVRSDFGSLIFGAVTGSADGDVTGNHGSDDAWMVKIDVFGKIIWQKAIGGSNADEPDGSIAKTTDGNVVIDGYSFSDDGDINGKDTLVSFMTKVNSNTGNIIWSKSYDRPIERGGFGVFATRDGGTVETGGVGVIDVFPTFDVLISKFDANGNEEWYKRLGGSSYDDAQNTGYESQNGNLNIMCLSSSADGDIKKSDGGIDTWLIKLGHCGESDNDNNAPVDFSQNNTLISKTSAPSLAVYPNPVSSSTTISFTLQQSQKVSIHVFDVSGRLIKNLADEPMQAGVHQLTWNATDESGTAVAKGLYIVKLQSGDDVQTKKISVIR